jgi:hypothetical protein
MGEYEDTVARLRQQGLDDEADVFEKFTATQLRQKAEKTDTLERENEQLRKENRGLVVAPKKDAALRAAGVDLEALRPADRQVLAGLEFEGDEPSDEWIAKTVADLQLPIIEGSQQLGEVAPNAAAVVNTATNAPAGGNAPSSGIVTPIDAANWSTEYSAKWAEDHPEAWEALKRGEEVTGVRTS